MAEYSSASPDGSPADGDLLKKLKGWFREDSEHAAEWREEAHEDYAFVAGGEGQWDQKDIKSLKEALRPVITFNRIDPLIRSVSGEQINNAQEVRYLPREMGDAKANELLTSAAHWVRDLCDADDEESEAFWDASICGIGVTETRIDMDETPDEPQAVIERVDPFEILVDCKARKRNFSDARRIWRIRSDIPCEEAEERYPDIAKSDLDASWAKLDEAGKIISRNEGNEYDGSDNPLDGKSYHKKTVTIVQCQWWERETYYKAMDPFTGETKDLDAEQFKTLSKRVAEMAAAVGTPQSKLQSVKLKKRVYKQAFIGKVILNEAKLTSPCPERFTFNFITGFRDRNEGHFYGLVRSMKDPQRWANKWLSQSLHIMNKSAKGGLMVEEGAVENWEQFKESWAKNDEVTKLADGAISGGKLQEKPNTAFPAGFFQLMEFAISSIRDVAGINLEMLGMREAQQAASLEYQRRQAGMTILATLFNSMRRYHRNEGRVLLYFIQNHLSDNRLIRIVGDEGEKYVPLVRQADIKYDIVVDEGPTTPNQKERVWSLVGEKFWTLPPPVQMALLEYSPFPTSVVEKVKQASQEASSGPAAQMQQQMMQLEMRLKEIEGKLKEAQTAKTHAEADKTRSEIGQNDPHAELQRDAMKTQSQMALQREKQEGELNLAREKQEGEMGMKIADTMFDQSMRAQESQAGIALSQAQAASQADLARQKMAQQPVINNR